MPYLASDKIAVIDLASGQITEDSLSDDLLAESIGGAGINRILYEQHADGDPIVIGAGLLTGTLVPGSAAATVTAKSPLTGALAHAPLTLYSGMEFKYSGFDYLVLKNKAAAPVYLWLHDGIADISDAADIWPADVWSATKSVRATMGDELIQTLVAGPAAVKGSALGQLMQNFWASGDRLGMGRALAMKNVKLIAIRGMGLLEIADAQGFVAACLELTAAIKAGPLGGKKGLGELGAALGQPGAGDWIAPIAHRHRAGFNTPLAYNTFAMLDADPKALKEPAEEAPGVLLSDPAAALELMKLGLNAKDACALIRDCAKEGLDVAGLVAASGAKDAAGLKAAMASASGPVPGLNGPFGPFAPPALAGADGGRRMALASVFGLDPIFACLAPELSLEKLIELADLGAGLSLDSAAVEALLDQLAS